MHTEAPKDKALTTLPENLLKLETAVGKRRSVPPGIRTGVIISLTLLSFYIYIVKMKAKFHIILCFYFVGQFRKFHIILQWSDKIPGVYYESYFRIRQGKKVKTLLLRG
ncbi:hypothetical protein A2276_07980 [candidate division WOR-1 bacterium RIFOXYA12_FULL_43_27]|uniref:Uncharacterized protein n=1 Tax=candidate division WOR-1 bacterium RIFOXYC2_FULL_46_14 TaxID=1802587 RepID=A0A1F4U676_UNCSA|nr:MAG: hypothetical protein A2276_07980 [candidate division WOR-1 bacterium RIFOXYA12_FULL_43_27]OGC20536.1 MAG: hypothetical protein A2292_05805 [candidate division WOR-1 bacterium RIFOXYB2_FULL_46_45]OGC31727.1 MAG: hypothetical protein A2232_05645 [candidate division WOR-1 bacterium RIFOXYA2_FULL_46_56]OGC40379.1 MAG: hypothetical protein A2438_03830 [candidate division WOR-1 bacterium RIFOXYC2_FULL_46_14]